MHKRIIEKIRDALVKILFPNNKDDFKRIIALESQVKWLSSRVKSLEEQTYERVF